MNKPLVLEHEKGIYIVKSDFDRTILSFCIKAGCDRELPGKNGLAHLVEHICLSYKNNASITGSSIIDYKKTGFKFTGYTNFGQTVLNIQFPNNEKCLKMCSQILFDIFSTFIVNDNTLETSKKEILSECSELSVKWDYQSKVIRFITDNEISVLPVGNESDIKRLTKEDARIFIENFYNNANAAFIIMTSMLVPTVKRLILPTLPCNKDYINSNISELKAYKSSISDVVKTLCLKYPENQNKVEIFFHKPYEPVDIKKKVVRMFFETMMRSCINTYIKDYCPQDIFNDCYISDKHITDFFYFSVFTLYFKDCSSNMLEALANKVVTYLKEYNFSEYEYSQAKDFIIKCVSNIETLEPDDIFENLAGNFFYNEPIHVTNEQYVNILQISSKLEARDINEYKKWAVTAPCKIIITT